MTKTIRAACALTSLRYSRSARGGSRAQRDRQFSPCGSFADHRERRPIRRIGVALVRAVAQKSEHGAPQGLTTIGGLDSKTAKHLDGLARGDRSRADRSRRLKPGTVLLREYQGERHTVTVVAKGC